MALVLSRVIPVKIQINRLLYYSLGYVVLSAYFSNAVQEIYQLPTSIEKLVSTVSWNKEVYEDLQELIADARTLSGKYSLAMQNEGRQVLMKKAEINYETNPVSIKVEDLKVALRALLKQLKIIRDDMLDLEGQIHHRIEDCRKHINQHNLTILEKNKEVIRLKLQCNELEGNINTCERKASEQDSLATKQDNEARRLSDKADKREVAGVAGSGVILVAGFLLAPFTGGASVVLASGAAVGNLVDNMISAADFEKAAKSHRFLAQSKRHDASKLRSEKVQLRQRLSNMETEIQNLEKSKGNLTKEKETLGQVVLQLYPAIDFLNTKITQIQDLEQTLIEAELEGDGFNIIKAAFIKNPLKYGDIAQRCLENLQEKWRRVESGLRLEN